jgi:DNA polymerase-3 subunit epsilon/ATP-dependent DNA helicase DinG
VRFAPSGEVLDRLEVLVDPGIPVPVAIQRLTGLSDADLRGAPSPAEAVAMLADFAESAQLVAHGAPFDLAHCLAVLPDVFRNRPCLDTLDLARILLPTAISHSLPVLSAELGVEHEHPHRAGSDAEATRGVLVRLIEQAEALPAPILAAILGLLRPLTMPLTPFFTELVAGAGDPLKPEVAGARPRPAVVVDRPSPLLDRSIPLPEAAVRALDATGPLAAGLPGYERREAQLEMARAVAQTLERSGRLLVEAGAGTGKSVAYLTPLALWTARTGQRAVVATHTVNLQEQLAERDLPALLAQVGIPATSAMLKGRHHYLSLRRWQRFLGSLTPTGGRTPDHDSVRFALRVLCWLGQTHTGDRAEMRLGGGEEELWRRVESTVDDCLGPACANWRDAGCYMVAARRAAAEADIVVVNQALLVADSERQGRVLTDYEALVVDEAQHLEETATRQLGTRLRAADVLSVVDRLRQPAEDSEELAVALAGAREAATRLFGEVKGHIGQLLGTDNPGNAVVGLTDQLRGSAELAPVLRAAHSAALRLRRAAATLLEARGVAPLQTALLPQPDRGDDELALAAAALGAHADAMTRVLLEENEGHVAWLELRAEQAELHEAPVSVGDALNEKVFERTSAAVLTSATLSVAGAFDFIASRTGMQRAATLRLASPFDYLRQALTVVVSDMPPYDAVGYDRALATLVADVARRLGGRTMALFTAYAPLRGVHQQLGSSLEADRVAVLGQGIDGTRRQVLASYLQNPRAVLLGTSSFWEGVDIPGEALRCVVIAKLPFPVPSDPLTAARAAELIDPFSELALPVAVLRLKQGFGRLIRHGNARGAVVLCDTRVLNRDYGATFLRALPEATVANATMATAGAVVDEFVARGRIAEGLRLALPTVRTTQPDDEGVA